MSLTARLRGRRHGEDGFDRRLVAPMVLGSVLNPVNSSIIAVSLVPIGRDFAAPPSQTAWLVSGLYLATAVGQPIVGRLVDLFGPRRLFLAATSLVGVAGVLGMLAPNLPLLVGARVLLGLGTCAGYPASMFLIRSEAERTGQDSPSGILTVLAVANQTVAVLGPPLGGLLIGVAGWRSTLAVNVPLSLACLWLGSRRLPRSTYVGSDTHDTSRSTGRRLDLPGMVLFVVGLLAALLFLGDLQDDRWWLVALSVLCLTGFVLVERRAAEPFIDLRVLSGNAPLVATYVRNLLTAVVSYLFLYGFTQWLQDGRGLSAAHAGLVLLPMFLTAIVVSSASGRRPQVRGKLLVGAVFQVLAWALMLLVGASSAVWLLLCVPLVLGLPQGLLNLANQNALYHQAEPERLGSSAGLLRTSLYLGAIVASAANGFFFGERADTAGLHHLAAFAIVVSALTVLVTLGDRSLARVGRPTT